MKRVWVDGAKCLGCKTCELACAVERHSVGKTLAAAVAETPGPIPRVAVHGPTGASFPIQCRHCQDATCLAACPSGAMKRDEASGVIYVDATRCRGCWMCVMSCPFGAVQPSPAKVAVKCDACKDMERPACVAACPTGALICGEEQDYQKTLADRRGRVALWAGTRPGRGLSALDFTREDDR